MGQNDLSLTLSGTDENSENLVPSIDGDEQQSTANILQDTLQSPVMLSWVRGNKSVNITSQLIEEGKADNIWLQVDPLSEGEPVQNKHHSYSSFMGRIEFFNQRFIPLNNQIVALMKDGVENPRLRELYSQLYKKAFQLAQQISPKIYEKFEAEYKNIEFELGVEYSNLVIEKMKEEREANIKKYLEEKRDELEDSEIESINSLRNQDIDTGEHRLLSYDITPDSSNFFTLFKRKFDLDGLLSLAGVHVVDNAHFERLTEQYESGDMGTDMREVIQGLGNSFKSLSQYSRNRDNPQFRVDPRQQKQLDKHLEKMGDNLEDYSEIISNIAGFYKAKKEFNSSPWQFVQNFKIGIDYNNLSGEYDVYAFDQFLEKQS